jgi:competence protein ComEA
VVELSRSQLAGYAVAGVFVLLLGARYLRGEGSGSAPAAKPAASAGVRLRSAGGGAAVVDVAGAVRRPGVYRLRAGARIQDAVRRAGGLTRDAAPGGVNLAARVADGAQIVVPARGPPGASVAAGPGASAAPVNLNTATIEQLDGLDGIGPVTAQKILEYRRAHGGFASLRDLDRIPGIGPKRIAALRGKVVV